MDVNTCKKCKVTKLQESFKLIQKTQKFETTCKTCRNEVRRAQYVENNRKQQNDMWRKQNANFRAQQLAYREGNKLERLETQRRYRARVQMEDPQRANQRNERRKHSHELYNALDKNDTFFGMSSEPLRAWMRFNGHDGREHHIDHVIPLCVFHDGDLHIGLHWGNLLPLTPHENFRKHKKILPWYIFRQEYQLRKFAKAHPDFSDSVHAFIAVFTEKFFSVMQDGQIAGNNLLGFDYHSPVRKPGRRTQLIADPIGQNVEDRVNPQPSS